MIYKDEEVKGMEFPNAYDRARVQEIQTNRRLWQAKHEEVFTRVSSGLNAEDKTALQKHWAGLKYVCVNLLGLLSRDTAEHLSLEPSIIASEQDQKEVDDIRDVSMWDSIIMDIVEECSALGEIGLKIYTKEQETLIDTVSPDLLFRGEDYFQEYQALNQDPRITIAPFIATLVGDYVLFEIHEQGAVIWRAYLWKTDKPGNKNKTFSDKGVLGREVEPYDEMPQLRTINNSLIETGIEEPTLLLVQNEPNQFDRRHGRSDYTQDLKDLQGEFEDKISVLLRHFHELVNGGITIMPEEMRGLVLNRGGSQSTHYAGDFGREGGATSETVPTVDPAEYGVLFEHSQNKGIIRHVSRAAQYEGGLQSLQLILSCFETVSNMTIDDLLNENKAPESGRAMRLSRYKDIKRVKRKGMRLSRWMAKAYEIALLLNSKDDRVNYKFPEPYPLEEMEQIEAAQLATGKPIFTRETALVRYMNLTTEEAEEEAGKQEAAENQAGQRPLFGQKPITPKDIENA